MIRLEKISVDQLTTQDIEWIVRSCLKSFDGCRAAQVVAAAEVGHVGIHRISGDAQGIIVFEKAEFDSKQGLKIIGIAGKDLLRYMSDLNDQVRVAARACGAEFLWGMTNSSGLGRTYIRKAKAKKVAEVYVEDLT